MATLEGYLYYTCIQQPKLKYESTEKEYSVSVLVDKDVALEWKEKYPKQKAKIYDEEDFAEAFKGAEIPNGETKAYVITLKQDAKYKSGNPLKDEHKPKVFMQNPETGKLKDVTKTTLVGNGSKGVVSYREFEHPKYGMIAKLHKGVRVDELVPYAGSVDSDDDFGQVEDEADEFATAPKVEAAEEAPAKPAKKTAKVKAKVEAEEDDEDGPF